MEATMPEAYIIDAVRSPIGRKKGRWPACIRPTSVPMPSRP